jgi:hypothetical protein
MDPYVIEQLMTARRDDLVRDADESRLVQEVREAQDEAPPRPASGGARAKRLRIA